MAIVFSMPAMPAMRLPAGWPRLAALNPVAVPPERWTISTTNATVAATISTPIAMTKTLRNLTEDPLLNAERHEIQAPPEAAGMRADRFFAEAIGSLSRSRVKALIVEGHASRDGQSLREPAETIRPGAVYALEIPEAVTALPQPQAIPLNIIHEDADLIVLDKPAGLVVHPAPGNLDGTLVNALLAHAGDDLPGIGGERRPGIVHRLDKDTSGVMVVAKTELALRRLSESFAERDLERHYIALCWGLPAAMEGEINAPIGRHPADRKRMAVVERGGKHAVTQYKVLRSWGTACALISCRLLTGRTHQIRVHLAHMGHPLVGDPVYLRRTPAAARALPESSRDALLAFPRQALHAASLGFRHPISGQALHFERPLPADMTALFTLLDGNTE